MLRIFTKKSQGYTLVEILIVIIVIGILAGVILVAMGSARERAKDVRIKTNMLQIQSLAEGFYLDEGNYGNFDCSVVGPDCLCSDEALEALCEDIYTQGSSLTIEKPSSSPVDQYCSYAFLNSFNNCVDPGPALEAFCVDSWGTAKKVGIPSDVHCLSNFLCVAYFDSNGDGVVKNDDLNAAYSGSFGCGPECSTPNPSCYDPKLDINNDGCINILDILQLTNQSKPCTT